MSPKSTSENEEQSESLVTQPQIAGPRHSDVVPKQHRLESSSESWEDTLLTAPHLSWPHLSWPHLSWPEEKSLRVHDERADEEVPKLAARFIRDELEPKKSAPRSYET